MTAKGAKKKAQRLNRLILIAFVLLAALFLFALGMLIYTLTGYKTDRDRYAEAAAFAVPASPSAAAAVETPTPSPTPSGEADMVYAGEQAVADLPQETPPVTVDFDALTLRNKETAGWLYCADTPINYPVMLGSDNTYYLTHAYNGDKATGGALFFDVRTDPDLQADNLIIYGHHMKDRSMFGTLKRYRDEGYYQAHPVLYLLTPSGSYRVELFSARTAPSDPDYYPVYFQTDAQRSAYIAEAIADSGLPVSAKEEPYRMVTLVTCSYNGEENDKYILHGWLVPL